MMDGTLAILFLLTGLFDMWVNHCESGCLKPVVNVARHAISTGTVIFEADTLSTELYYRYDSPVHFGPFQPAVGISLDLHGDMWFGLGAVNDFHAWDQKGFAQFSFMPGVWLQGEGPALGYPIEFRSGIDAGIETPDGTRFSVSLDHRSNGELGTFNPGLETLQLRASLPTR